MRTTWNGSRIVARAEADARLAIDKTTAAAVTIAKHNHGWENRTGTLEGSLQMRPAEDQASRIVGQWGSFDVNYAALMEFLKGEIIGDTGAQRTRSGGSPYLRPAADAEYPKLPARLAAAYRGVDLP